MVLHVLSSYQIYSYPVFDLIETSLARVAAPAAAPAGTSAPTEGGPEIGQDFFADVSKLGQSDPRAIDGGGLAYNSPGPDSDSILNPYGSAKHKWDDNLCPSRDCQSRPIKPSAISKFLHFLGPSVRRQVIRLLYISSTCFIASLIPFFGDLLGLIGAIGVTPTTYVLPCLLWLTIKRPSPLSGMWWLCWTISFVAGVIGVLGAIASVYSIAQDAQAYRLFGIVGH